MESFEFLGGRYNRPEQIMSGPVQAFRAQNAANGRTVFIHRVSTTEAPEEQSALLKLLTTAVVKSPDAKRLVLDFGEERGYWYVVTESEPQCALLREWLQLEIDALNGGARPSSASPPAASAPPSKLQPAADPGEFTRFLQSRTPSSPASTSSFTPPSIPGAALPAGEFSKLFQASPPPPPPPQPARPVPGEFTNFFNSTEGARPNPVPAPAPIRTDAPSASPPPPVTPVPPFTPPVQTESAAAEPGEFTRFFNAGLPPVSPKPVPLPATSNFERTQNNPYVQRPNTPVPSPTDAGEFTKLFSRPENAKTPLAPQVPSIQQPAVRSDPMGFANPVSNRPPDLSDDLFSNEIEIGRPMPSAESKSGEFTKIFGKMGAEAPPVQPASGVASPPVKPLLDESTSPVPPAGIDDAFKVTQPLPVMKPQTPATEAPSSGSSPSEFTMIMRGGYAQNKPAEPAGTQAGPGPSAAPQEKGKAPGMPAMGGMKAPTFTPPAIPRPGNASASAGGVHANAGLGGASLGASQIPGANIQIPPPKFQMPGAGKAGSNKKLVIFLVCLGIVALILIVVVMLLMKTQ